MYPNRPPSNHSNRPAKSALLLVGSPETTPLRPAAAGPARVERDHGRTSRAAAAAIVASRVANACRKRAYGWPYEVTSTCSKVVRADSPVTRPWRAHIVGPQALPVARSICDPTLRKRPTWLIPETAAAV